MKIDKYKILLFIVLSIIFINKRIITINKIDTNKFNEIIFNISLPPIFFEAMKSFNDYDNLFDVNNDLLKNNFHLKRNWQIIDKDSVSNLSITRTINFGNYNRVRDFCYNNAGVILAISALSIITSVYLLIDKFIFSNKDDDKKTKENNKDDINKKDINKK
jgi:hypothetical protein